MGFKSLGDAGGAGDPGDAGGAGDPGDPGDAGGDQVILVLAKSGFLESG